MPDTTSRGHRFKVGSLVRLNADLNRRGAEDALYKIVRQLPAEAQGYQYRIKDSRTNAEYVVLESALR